MVHVNVLFWSKEPESTIGVKLMEEWTQLSIAVVTTVTSKLSTKSSVASLIGLKQRPTQVVSHQGNKYSTIKKRSANVDGDTNGSLDVFELCKCFLGIYKG